MAKTITLIYGDGVGKEVVESARKIIDAVGAGVTWECCEAGEKAFQKVCQAADWDIKSIDLFEINEAFAVVPLAAMQVLSLDERQVNVCGGACALGHPLGASGARIVGTLLYALQERDLRRGVASVCIGGGEGMAVAIERDLKHCNM